MEDLHDFNTEGHTPEQPEVDEKEYCNFCGKFEKDVLLLIAGPRGVFVCNECIELIVDIIRCSIPDFCLGEKP